MSYVDEIYERVVAQNPGEPEFHQAVKEVLEAGYRTKDIMSDGNILVGTKEMGDQICSRIRRTA